MEHLNSLLCMFIPRVLTPSKVAILFGALELPYNVKLWTFGTDEVSFVSWENMACLNYLLWVYDLGNVFGASSEEEEKGKVEMDQWISFLVSTMGLMIGQCNWIRYYIAILIEDDYKRYEAQAYRSLDVLKEQLI
ncbi:hypothetical protein KC318_g2841 [Hortaea werneckii]|nr:hypothetical protein KC334_g4233 [Hortaea werneckii]KAI7672492.1 hypothetical protein KC318_g2841 [Hortaea werneckii]